MLNPQQTAAVNHIDGPLLVLAGAGSGKTRVITQKIAHLIQHCNYPAKSVFAVTFTNKAANEMRERVAMTVPAESRRGLKVSTFHALGLTLIKQEVEACGLTRGFSIYDSDDTAHILKDLLPKAAASDRDYVLNAQQCISNWKNELLRPEQLGQLQLAPGEVELVALYTRYQQTLQSYNAVDFDDLICMPTMLLRDDEAIRHRWQQKVRYLLVDEYQDSNTCQYELVKLLTGHSQCFTVVGDDDQSIYAWRGARPENMAQLQQDYQALKVIKLEQNYRSTGIILNAANHLIANNTHLFSKKLWSQLGHGELIRVVCCRDENHEAEQVVTDIVSHRLRHNNRYGDYVILYRGNHQARLFEKVLRHYGVPYRISGGQSWFARKEIKDVFAYLKLLANPADDAALLRIINTPKRGIGEVTLKALVSYAAEQQKSVYSVLNDSALAQCMDEKPRQALSDLHALYSTTHQALVDGVDAHACLRELIDATGYEAYLYGLCETPQKAQRCMENVWDLLAWIKRLMEKEDKPSLIEVLNKLMLIDRLEQSDEHDDESVQLMTLHASKGLEFPHAYLVGMEEELLPHRSSIESGDIEEERRLAYVGITRAQKSLCMTYARRRRRAGEIHRCTPSRFLEELPQDYLEWSGRGNSTPEQSQAQAKSHLEGLRAFLDG